MGESFHLYNLKTDTAFMDLGEFLFERAIGRNMYLPWPQFWIVVILKNYLHLRYFLNMSAASFQSRQGIFLNGILFPKNLSNSLYKSHCWPDTDETCGNTKSRSRAKKTNLDLELLTDFMFILGTSHPSDKDCVNIS